MTHNYEPQYKMNVYIPETWIQPNLEPTIIFGYRHVYFDHFGFRFTKRIKSQKSRQNPNPLKRLIRPIFSDKEPKLNGTLRTKIRNFYEMKRLRIRMTVYLIIKSILHLEIQMGRTLCVLKTSS